MRLTPPIETTQDARGWEGRGKVRLARLSRTAIVLQYQGLSTQGGHWWAGCYYLSQLPRQT